MSIEHWSHFLATALCRATDREDDIEYIRYAFEIIIGALLTIIALYGIASGLDVLQECLVITITFALFRAFMGGYHFSHFYHCFSVTVIGFNGLAWLVKHGCVLNQEWNLLATAILVAFVAWITIKYVPINAYYRSNTLQQRVRFKKITLVLLVSWLTLCLMSWNYGWSTLPLALFVGLLAQAITLPIELWKMRKEDSNEKSE